MYPRIKHQYIGVAKSLLHENLQDGSYSMEEDTEAIKWLVVGHTHNTAMLKIWLKFYDNYDTSRSHN